MFRNYLKVASRTLLHNKSYAAINIFGLAVGVACCLFIFLYVEDELSFDRFHDQAQDIYRLRVERFSSNGEAELAATSSAPMLPAAVSDIAEIESAVRLNNRTYLVENEDRKFYEDLFYFVDSTFFDVFSFKLIRGDPNTVLVSPFSIVLTERMVEKYFGTSDPIDQVVRIEGRLATVRGVVENPPAQSHFDFDILASFTSLEVLNDNPSENWNWWDLSYHTYLRMVPNANLDNAKQQILEMPSRYIGNQESVSGYRQFLYLQPVTDIHLKSAYQRELGNNSQEEYVFVFGAIALFVLLLACINFINLATARSTKRAKEVGMRKVSGASKKQLVIQFLSESVLISLLSVFLALILVTLLLPLFNQLAFKTLTFSYLTRYGVILGLVAGGILIGVLAGFYPAFVLSGFRPSRVLKGEIAAQGGSVFFREALVVFQFVISVSLIIGAVVAQRQLEFMRSADLGFEKEQVLVINTRNNEDLAAQYEVFKEELSKVSGVIGSTFSSSIPGRSQFLSVISEDQGMTDDGQTFNILAVDHDFIDVYEMDVIAGRSFSIDMVSDDSAAFITNEAAFAALGYQDADDIVGVELTRQFSDTRDVIGVVSDFHFESLQNEVEPIVLQIRQDWYRFVSVRLSPVSMASAIEGIQSVWSEFSAGRPMDYFFLDEEYDQQYRAEVRISGVINAFTTIAIIIACLGLFGLASFIAEQRTKEIGVRKVLGASTGSIVMMLSSTFTKLVVFSVVLSVPLAYWGANSWLENFVYRVPIRWDIFVVAGVSALIIAWGTVAYQSIRAAIANPVDALHRD